MQSLNIYIHIPFCFSKCPYCAFFSCTNCDDKYDEYFKTLNKEIITKSKLFKSREVKTIYIGGGTPNLVPYKNIVEVIQNIKNNFHINEEIEITIEQYPEYITEESLNAYKTVGINRISIGLQATDNDDLKLLTRRYTFEDFVKKYNLVKNLGFTDIGVDLIFGYPQHTLEKWKDTLEKITALDIQHISCYSLEIEEGTPYYSLYNQDKLMLPSETDDREMYHYACEFLSKKGFHQYEISNWCKKDFECKHNINFWHYQDYIGLGAGAYSRVGDTKSHNPEDIQRYINKEWNIEKEIISEKDIEKEKTILGLRLNTGINYDERIFQKEYMEKIGNSIVLNETGRDMYNQVVQRML